MKDGARGVDFVEAVTENFLGRGGRPRAVLERVRRDVPVALHGVSLSIGGVSPLNRDYLHALRALCDEISPAVVSDHLCFGTWGRHYGHDLWPLPYTDEALAHVVARVATVQDVLGRRLALENVSSYVTFADSQLSEWEFLSQVARRADCDLLLDINNVYVSAYNHGFTAERYIDAIPIDRVAQFHLAGHRDEGAYLLDDHGSVVPPPVWALHRRAVSRFGADPDDHRMGRERSGARRADGRGGKGTQIGGDRSQRGRPGGGGSMTLESLQRSFWQVMRHPSLSADRLDPCFRGDARLPACDRMSIYRGAYWTRQLEALRDEFRRVAAAVGEVDFAGLMKEYLDAHPSRDPRIEMIGCALPGFLRAHQSAPRRCLADLAAFEWAEVEALLAADPPELTIGFDVPSAVFPACTFEMVPALRVLAFVTDPLSELGGVPSPTAFAVWRRGFSVQIPQARARRAPSRDRSPRRRPGGRGVRVVPPRGRRRGARVGR